MVRENNEFNKQVEGLILKCGRIIRQDGK